MTDNNNCKLMKQINLPDAQYCHEIISSYQHDFHTKHIECQKAAEIFILSAYQQMHVDPKALPKG
jgi:hypothetical protein